MATTEIAWGDGSGDKIYLTSDAFEGDQNVLVSSDANSSIYPRSKDIIFSNGNISTTLSVTQDVPYPAGYKSVQYVSCLGHSAFNTKIVVGSTDSITVTYEITNKTQAGDKFIATVGSGQVYGIWVETYGNTNPWYARFGSSTSVNISKPAYVSGKHTLVLKKQSLAIDGTRILAPAYNQMPSVPLHFGGRILNNGTVLGMWGYIYECSIKDSGGNYRFHGIPVVRLHDNVAGIYDTVSSTFFTSAEDDFGAGPDVT